MPLYLRNVGALDVPDPAYDPKAGGDLLRRVNAHKLVGLLNQLNDLSQFAADLFGEIFVDAQASGDRLFQLAQRVRTLEAAVPQVRQAFAERDPASWYLAEPPEQEPWSRGPDELAHSLFTAERQPVVLQQMRLTLTDPLPNLATLDYLAGHACAPLYSDPGLFLREWLSEEHSRQAAIQERKQRSRAARKAKRGGAGRRSSKKQYRGASDDLGGEASRPGLEPLDERQEAEDEPQEQADTDSFLEQPPPPSAGGTPQMPRTPAPSQPPAPPAESPPGPPSRQAPPPPPGSPEVPPPEDEAWTEEEAAVPAEAEVDAQDPYVPELDEEPLPPPDDREEEMSASLITADSASMFPSPPGTPRLAARGTGSAYLRSPGPPPSLPGSRAPSAPASPALPGSPAPPAPGPSARDSPPKPDRLGLGSPDHRPGLRRTISPSRTRENISAAPASPLLASGGGAGSGGLLDQIRSNNGGRLKAHSAARQVPGHSRLNKAGAPSSPAAQPQTQSTVMYILSRRAAIEGSDESSDSDDDDFD